MAAMNTLECILTVLNSCQEKPELFAGLEARLLPMLHRLLHPSGDGIEHLESVCQILAWLTFMTPTISPHLWQLFDMLCVWSRCRRPPSRFRRGSSLRRSRRPPPLALSSAAIYRGACCVLLTSFLSSRVRPPSPPSHILPTPPFHPLVSYTFFMQHGFDYIPNMVSPIDSYIARGADVLFADDRRPKMVFDICQHVFSRVRDGCNHEIASACKLLQVRCSFLLFAPSLSILFS